MISYKNNYFRIDTKKTSYLMRIDETKHLVLEYYGALIQELEKYDSIEEKWPFAYGDEVVYNHEMSSSKSLDLLSLEYSSVGKGDYNEPSIILCDKSGYVFDFVFDSYRISKIPNHLLTLPSPHNLKEELIVTMKELSRDVYIDLYYQVDNENDIICRNLIIRNKSNENIIIKKVASMQLEMVNQDFELLNLYGGWISECHKEICTIAHGIYINDSKTGASSARHNPFFMIKEKSASVNNGLVYAFNLIYSGNHQEMVERTAYDKIRIQAGISPYCFEHNLKTDEQFETPFVVMSCSRLGINKTSQNMHHFINEHIIRGPYQNKMRPIVINNWEATNFDFSEAKLLSIAKKAKDLGIELFVLDDGWFSNRNNDKAGLGDYNVNLKKLPHNLNGLAKKINKLGLKFGLWFEPESVNEDSNLFKAHPEYALKIDGIKPSYGRNQLHLDFTKSEVCDYVVENVNKVLDSANIEFVKWDMNRSMSDFHIENANQGEFFHRYIIGLYDVLKRITSKHPNVLFENCSSGGNRNDLGMLSYMQQSWASDDTDGFERINIQSGLALGYPLSTISCHVSTSPSQQLLRSTPINTRFNVASFGILGYELDLNNLSPLEIEETKKDIDFYKKHRELLQFGNFYQLDFMEEKHHATWMVQSKDKKEAIIGYFNSLQSSHPITTILAACDFVDKKIYKLEVKEVKLNIKTFGSLINMVSPIRLNENGLIIHELAKHKAMDGEKEEYIVSGDMLNNGAIKLKPEWAGVGFDQNVRVLADFGSRLYYIKALK